MTERELFMSGKRYPEELKIEAVKQIVDRGYSVISDLGPDRLRKLEQRLADLRL